MARTSKKKRAEYIADLIREAGTARMERDAERALMYRVKSAIGCPAEARGADIRCASDDADWHPRAKSPPDPDPTNGADALGWDGADPATENN